MNPFVVLFLLLAVVPLTELFVLIKVGEQIGALATVGLVVFTAAAGTALIRYQGLRTMTSVREAVARGEVPAMQMVEGMALLVGGALLLTPGFLTDAIGFVLLIPPLRRTVIRRYLERVQTSQESGSGPYTIEGRYRRHDD